MPTLTPELVYRAKNLTVDLERREVFVGNKEVLMEPKIFDTLVVLLKADGKILSRDEIVEMIYEGYSTRRISSLNPRVVDQHISRLRKKLGTAGDLVRVVSGHGYKLVRR